MCMCVRAFTHCHLEEIAALQSNTDVFIIKEKSILFTEWAWLQPIFNFKTSSTLIYIGSSSTSA